MPTIKVDTQHSERNRKNGRIYDLIAPNFHNLSTTPMQILDTYFVENKTFEHYANLFPDKLSNLMGKNLYLALFNYQPYTIATEVVSEHYILRHKEKCEHSHCSNFILPIFFLNFPLVYFLCFAFATDTIQ